ncbi:peptide deformylase [Bacteroidota bacterium]
MIQAFGNNIYKSASQKVGKQSAVAEIIVQLKALQQKLEHPYVSAKHIGLNLQLFVVDLNYAKYQPSNFKAVFINPEILSVKAPLVSQLEDDLSIPKLSVSIERPIEIELRFLDENFEEQKEVFSNLAARWILHGIDQLNGKSIVDCLNKHRQRSIKGHLKKIAEHKIESNYKLEFDAL